jgi:DNA modification methylase
MNTSLQIIQYSHTSEMSDTIPGVQPASQRIVFADPPYNIGVKYADDPTRDKLPIDRYAAWAEGTIFTMSQQLKPGGTCWWLCPAAHVGFIPQLLTKHVGPQLYMIIKEETFAQYQQKTLTEDYRLLFVNQKPGGELVFNPNDIRIPSARLLQKKPDKRADPRGRVPGQIWKFRRLQGTSDDRVDWHPAQLPPELLSRIALGWSNKGDSILDAFAGSGNFGEVCRAVSRSFIGTEQSPTYVAKINERLGLA